jgi:putative transposase
MHVGPFFQREIAFVGIESSPPFVRAPEVNGCAERFIRMLKMNLLWVGHLGSVEEPHLSLLAFRESYSAILLIERHGFISPAALQ